MADRHPAIRRLDVLVGTWTVQPKVEGLGPATATFTWLDGGQFLLEHSDMDEPAGDMPEVWRQNLPFPINVLIGLDEASGEYTRMYADGRGVHRVYRMTFGDNGELRYWRDAEGFNQRFIGQFSSDDNVVEGRYDTSEDGVEWRLDFGITMTRRI